jgi:hypothetical protein
MEIIGLGHYSRVGKDTFANYLVDALHEYNPRLTVVKRSFAWKLKEITHELYAWAGLREPEFYEGEGAALRQVKLPLLGLTPVEVWVKFGDAVRNNVDMDTWLNYLLHLPSCDVLIIPDVRFLNEVDAIREVGGKLYKIVRPGFGPLNTPADKALADYTGWDATFGEDGSILSLQHAATRVAKEIACFAA